MAENSVTEGDPPTEEVNEKNVLDVAGSKPLKMSFADWKKSKETSNEAEYEPAVRNGRQSLKYDNKQQNGNKNNHNNTSSNNNNNNNSYAPLSRPPPLPFPLLGFGNFGPGPGPCGPPPMMSPVHNMGKLGSGQGPRNHRPLQPPPFWQDMMSPQHRTPPIQPPMPKCPSLWNLVPKDKGNQRQNKKQQNQPNKKYKTCNNADNNSNQTSGDAALMPPPPAPTGINSSSSTSTSTISNSNPQAPSNGVVKKKKGGTFVQIDGKWIQRPEAPPPLEEAPPGTKEDRQRQWREYRQAMKPFKNREFHNWKRTVQRLSKLPRNQLDERQLERLQKAEEYIGAHKAMLTIKHAEHWVVQNNNQKPEGSGTVQGQVYIRKQAIATWNRKDNQNTFQQGPVPGRNPTYVTGRAIKGGVGNDLNTMPALPTTAPPPPIGQFPDLSCPPMTGGYFGQTQGYNSNMYGQEAANSNSSPFYTNYNSSFVKGGTLLPP